MPITYNVSIESTTEINRFQITWHNLATDKKLTFQQTAEITPEETRLWQKSIYQQPIGQKLFHFLDGSQHQFQHALKQAHLYAETLHIHLHTNRETADWPFELLIQDDQFLLTRRLHLDRTVSDWGIEKKILPKNRPLKLLFMACSALDVKPVLDYEREEEAIYQITQNLTIDMEVEDSGSLEGLRSHLEREQYDVVHLSGHADIDDKGRPYFIMENKRGFRHDVYPDELWRDALIESPPRLLLLSGCRTGETPDGADGNVAVSFSRQLVEHYHVPAVLGWGRSVSDAQAIKAETMLFHELCRGKSILEAVQRARYEMITDFPMTLYPAWPLLRLFSSGIPLNAIVQKNQHFIPKPRRMKHVFLRNSRVKVLADGFVGRRRQMQTGLQALEDDYYKVGIMILGAGGLGKSCLAGKICERFTDFTLIIVHGILDAASLETALADAFVSAQDTKGNQILAQDSTMKKKLANLCATSFKEKNYLLLLDDFDRNLQGAECGSPGSLLPEAEDLLKTLLRYLPFSGKMTQMIVTGRYEFPVIEHECDMLDERLDKIWLTSFRELEQRKKVKELKNILNYKDQSEVSTLLKAGHGNPLLMERLDQLAGGMQPREQSALLEAVKIKQNEFIMENTVRATLQQSGSQLSLFLAYFSIFRRPVREKGAEKVAQKAGLEKWKQLLREAMALSLVEFDQVHGDYQVMPLLRDQLLESIKEPQICHDAAAEYYKEICLTRDDVSLSEELTYHVSGGY